MELIHFFFRYEFEVLRSIKYRSLVRHANRLRLAARRESVSIGNVSKKKYLIDIGKALEEDAESLTYLLHGERHKISTIILDAEDGPKGEKHVTVLW